MWGNYPLDGGTRAFLPAPFNRHFCSFERRLNLFCLRFSFQPGPSSPPLGGILIYWTVSAADALHPDEHKSNPVRLVSLQFRLCSIVRSDFGKPLLLATNSTHSFYFRFVRATRYGHIQHFPSTHLCEF